MYKGILVGTSAEKFLENETSNAFRADPLHKSLGENGSTLLKRFFDHIKDSDMMTKNSCKKVIEHMEVGEIHPEVIKALGMIDKFLK